MNNIKHEGIKLIILIIGILLLFLVSYQLALQNSIYLIIHKFVFLKII